MKLHTEKRIAPFVATQIHPHARSVRKQSLHFYQGKNARFDMRNLNLCGIVIIPYQIWNYKPNLEIDLISVILSAKEKTSEVESSEVFEAAIQFCFLLKEKLRRQSFGASLELLSRFELDTRSMEAGFHGAYDLILKYHWLFGHWVDEVSSFASC